MRLEGALHYTAVRATPDSFANFIQHIDPVQLEEALEATGTATVRKRRLPAARVLWIVLGMALFRNRAIERVVASLDLCLPSSTGRLVAKSAIAEARQRLARSRLRICFTRQAPSGRREAPSATSGADWACTSTTARQCACPIHLRTGPCSGDSRRARSMG